MNDERQTMTLPSAEAPTPLALSLRYGLAVVAVAAGYGAWRAVTECIGPGLPTFITFYPLVMVTALLAGFGPGLLATALSAVVVDVWIMPPLGQFSVGSPVDRLALALFGGMGLFISFVAELYRRNQQKAAAFDREAALREGEEALRRQAELIDPLRAEIIAREMLRVVRERRQQRTGTTEPAGDVLRHVPTVAGAVVAGVGVLVLIGWLFDVDALKSVLPGLATMKANTAICLLLAGVALLLRQRPVVRVVCTAVICAVAGLTLVQDFTGANFGLDQLLFRDTVNPHTVHPGRMVEATALGILLIAASLFLLGARTRAGRRTQQTFAVGAALIGAIAVLGYAYNAQQLYRFAGYSSMAVHTAASLLALAIGLICSRPDGLLGVLTRPGPASQLARRLLPAALLAPAVLGWLVGWGLQRGLYGEGMDLAVLALAMTLSLATLVWLTAHVVSRSDAARRESEIQLRNQAEVMNHAHDALIMRELEGVILFWNRGAEALYGWPAADAIGRPIHVLLRTDPAVVAQSEAALRRSARWEGELVHAARDGRRVTVESRKTAAPATDGRLLVLESNRDVSDRKRAEESLRESEERLRAQRERMPIGCIVYDECNRFSQLNPAAEAIFGYSQSELQNRHANAIVPDAARPHVDGILRRLAEGDMTAHSENENVTKDGRVIICQWTNTPLRDAKGSFVGFLSMVQDITERKRAEADLERTRNILSEGQRIAHLGSWELIAQTQATVWSEEQKRIYGLDPAAPSPSYEEMLRHHIHPDDAAGLDALFGEALRTHSVFENENRILRPDGSVRFIYNKADPYFDEAGNLVRYVGATLDITETKRAAEALKRSLHEKEVLLKEIHHRVKNNMQVISSLVALQAERLPDAATREVLQDVTHRVRSMALVHEKLYQSADMAKVEFAEYARGLLNYLWHAHGSQAAEVRLALDLEPVPLSVNAAVPCGLVLNELASNALKHAFGESSGDRELAVSLRGSPEGRVCLRVRDNGKGLPPGFDWRQADSLGLRLVQMLAGQLDAAVEVQSGRGTEFTMTFEGTNT